MINTHATVNMSGKSNPFHQRHVTRITLLRSDDRNKISTLLEEVVQIFSVFKNAADGKQVRFMQPGYHQVPLAQEETFGDLLPRNRVALWVCMPYISCKKYAGLGSAPEPNLYPNQTLMQAYRSEISRDRDMQQAVCQTNLAKTGACLHISSTLR